MTGNSATAYGASRAAGNAVENNQLTNPYGVKHLNEKELAVHNILYKAGVEDVEPYQQAFNQAQTVEERDAIIQQMMEADERSSQKVYDAYMRGELTRDQYLNTYSLSYAEKMMYGAGEGDRANGKLSNAGWLETSPYTYNSHNWAPAGLEKNNYLHSARIHALESELRDKGKSEKDIEIFRARMAIGKSYVDTIPGPDLGRNIYEGITSDDPFKFIQVFSLLRNKAPKAPQGASNIASNKYKFGNGIDSSRAGSKSWAMNKVNTPHTAHAFATDNTARNMMLAGNSVAFIYALQYYHNVNLDNTDRLIAGAGAREAQETFFTSDSEQPLERKFERRINAESSDSNNDGKKTSSTFDRGGEGASPTPPDPDQDPKDKDKKITKHGQQRLDEAKYDPHRNVGDINRVIREGKKYLDTETGHTVYVRGNRVIIQTPEGKFHSQF